MVHLVVRDFSQEEWSAALSGFEGLNLLQTWAYGEAKTRTGPWKAWRAVFLDDERVVGTVQALIRRLPLVPGGLVWVNRGPLLRPQDGGQPLLPAVLRELRRHWVEARHMYLRVALPSGDGVMAPAVLAMAGYRPVLAASGWASARLDLSGTFETLRAGLQRKWRNCVSKAERSGLEVRSGIDEPGFGAFLEAYERMLADRVFRTSVTPDLLFRLQDCSGPNDKMLVFSCLREGQLLGAILIARYGDTGEYVAGVVGAEGRAVNAGHLLLWRAIAELKALGYRWLDLGGMDPVLTPPGIYHFKAGLSGTPYRLPGEIEAHDGNPFNRLVRQRVERARQPAFPNRDGPREGEKP